MNSVVLIGRLTRDPETRYTSGSQMAVCTFTIAIDRVTRQGEEKKTDFPRITVFGKQAENCDRYLAKGRKAAVAGRIQTGSYEKDGRTVYTTEVIANNVEFLSSGQQGQGQSQGGYGQQTGFGQQGGFSQQAPAQDAPQPDIDVPGGFTSLQDDDIPF